MSSNEEFPAGEDLSTDMRRPFAKYANRLLRNLKSKDTVIDLGPEHGEVSTQHIRFRDAVEEGHLRAYIRQEATDPKVIVPAVIALGVIATGIHHLKYRKK
jgi:hypothetical protein